MIGVNPARKTRVCKLKTAQPDLHFKMVQKLEAEGPKSLNALLENQSYMQGYTPSQADIAVFEETYPHFVRWFKHIATLEKTALPAAKTVAEDEDDIDLFGSDEDDDEENEKLKAARVAEYNAKKANKPKIAAKSMVILDVKPWDDETDMEALKEGYVSLLPQAVIDLGNDLYSF